MTLTAVLVAMGVTAAPASAQTGNAYGGEANVLQEVTQSQGQTPVAAGDGTVQETPAGGTPTAGTPAGGDIGGEEAAGAAGPESAVAAEQGASLPFTGFDVLLMLGGGFVLVGVGAAMRRISAPAYE